MKPNEYQNDIFQKHLYNEREAFVANVMSVFFKYMRKVLERVERLLPYLENLPSNHLAKNHNDELQNCISLLKKGPQSTLKICANQINNSSSPDRIVLHGELSDQVDEESENSGWPREKAQAAFDEFPLGVSLLDHDGSFTYVNPKFVEIFGYTLQEIQSLAEWLMKAYPDEQSCQEATLVWNGIL